MVYFTTEEVGSAARVRSPVRTVRIMRKKVFRDKRTHAHSHMRLSIALVGTVARTVEATERGTGGQRSTTARRLGETMAAFHVTRALAYIAPHQADLPMVPLDGVLRRKGRR